MVQSVIQTSFHAGEWAPALNARVDLAKYHSAAALMRNFYVDYRGGASSRPGTRYCNMAYKSNKPVRLIPFQASTNVGYVLEFGDFYVRFYNQGNVIVYNGQNITGVSGSSITSSGPGFNVGDQVLCFDVGGVPNINGRTLIVTSTGATFTVTDLFGNSQSFSGYTSGGVVALLYTLGTPYAAEDLALLKFVKLLTLNPSRTRDPDVQTMRDAGWTDEQIWEVCFEVGIFSFLNRMADAHGLDYPTSGWYPPTLRDKFEKEKQEKEKSSQPGQ